MKRVITTFLVFLLLGLAVAGTTWYQFRSFMAEPLNVPNEGFRLMVDRGDTIRSVIDELDQQGVTKNGWFWRLLSRWHPDSIRAGEYELKQGLTPPDLLVLLSSDEVVRYKFTIVEGWTFKQLRKALSDDPVLIQTIPDIDGDSLLLKAINPELEHPEGWFLPETYQFVRGDSDLDILRRSHRDMKAALAKAWQGRMDGLPLKSAYELLTLASIVERESGVEAERADIAGVFIRRLNAGWRLETDPTVIYGLGDSYDGDIRRRDLNTDTPYNTYTRFGLPPTPIAMPGKSSLSAAASPADGTAMFFVASGSGGHVFSDTLEQHNAAVRKMLRKRP